MNPVASNKFTVTLKDQPGVKNNFALVTITPSQKGMELKDLWITASVTNCPGELKGAGGKKNSTYIYSVEVQQQSLENLYLISGCLGKEDKSFKKGKKVTFKLKYKPASGTPREKEYILTVKIEYKSSNPHMAEEKLIWTVS